MDIMNAIAMPPIIGYRIEESVLHMAGIVMLPFQSITNTAMSIEPRRNELQNFFLSMERI